MLAPIVAESDLSSLAKEVALSYPVGDLFVLLGLTAILLRAPHSRGHAPVLGILIAAFACLIVGDTWATLVVLQPSHAYLTGGFPDLFWLSFYLLLPLAALAQLRMSQRERAVKGDVARHKPDHEDLLWRDIKASLPLFLPIVAALLASVVLTIGAIVRAAETGWRAQVWPITAIFGLLLLVFMRQAIICLNEARLRREVAVAREREQATIELNRRKDEFLGVISHEIRTPLTSLQGNIYLLIRRFNTWWPRALGGAAQAIFAPPSVGEVERGRALLASCEEGLQQLSRLADDLTDDTCIRDGQLTLRRTPCDLRALVRTAVDAQRATEPDRVIYLLPSGAPSAAPLLVNADADRIAQVMTNYLSNALKYSRADQPVTVRVEDGESDQARVAVRDAGPGLPQAEQARIWERYPRIETVAVQSGSGVSLGLGLSISKAIIERHGGEVGVESTPGAGSTFWFTLPLLAPPATTSP
jgi:signal transduction histidine kinase